MRILVVCGAGASSTFVAQRMRVTLAARGLDVQVAAGSESELGASLGNIDVLLVGPHLAPQYAQICELAAQYGVSARLLPAEVFSVRNGDASVDLALSAAHT
ncbi:PTS sugar transporter subunit IIB [Cryobacterium melibiosiphilum]|uniref:PTS sugar transporter subunit IIB n=1 Tax=Cryobacterium melibiosiphilum TaxID=995039 RepID=A0A3A5MYE1_9MICO|nr:PTS sugar transporter subunit IIB [Cryobacterium melibiosiphilum]RJT91056.1 PTS sugar transporter subunit IIB [Cryobacterium melibiosiphilum]